MLRMSLMHTTRRVALVLLLTLLTACGPVVDKQFANRQVAYLDIQPATGANPMQVSLLKNNLQPALLSALRGRGNPPAVGMTVKIAAIDLPGEQGIGETLLGNGVQGGYVRGLIELWDPTTRTVMTSFAFGTGIKVHRETALGSVLGYPSGLAPQTAAELYAQLGQAAAQEIISNLYGN